MFFEEFYWYLNWWMNLVDERVWERFERIREFFELVFDKFLKGGRVLDICVGIGVVGVVFVKVIGVKFLMVFDVRKDDFEFVKEWFKIVDINFEFNFV